MAITRAQQVRQMLKDGDVAIQGGVENYLGKQPEVQAPRKWQSSPDKPATELAYITEAEKDLIIKENIHGGLEDGPNMGPSGIISLDSFGDIGGAGAGGADTSAGGGANEGASFSGRSVSEMGGGRKADQEYDRRIANEKAKLQMAERKQAERLGYDERENIADYGSADDLQRLYMRGVGDSNLPGFLGLGLNAISPFRDFTLRKNIDYFRDLEDVESKGYSKTLEGYKQYMSDRLAGKIDAAGNPIMRGNDDDNNMFLPADTTATTTEEEVLSPIQQAILDRGTPSAFLADGGMPKDAPVGGIMDLESGRQMYFLGKLVKKATRAVKKIVKSPVGKIALMYGLGSYGLGKGLFGGLPKAGFLNPDNKSMMDLLFKGGKISGGLTGGGQLALGGALTLAPLLFQQEEEQPDFASSTGPGLPAAIPDIRNRYRDYMARGFLAEGGKAEPVAKKTMPLLDMDGKEMDFRAEGGFVPIGRMERADDVPARLSKNEFVFTADAVRNAGEGDIDKGAEVMYNMMKNLEAGGEVSEESQGLDGARKMFQTSQRLEEVL